MSRNDAMWSSDEAFLQSLRASARADRPPADGATQLLARLAKAPPPVPPVPPASALPPASPVGASVSAWAPAKALALAAAVALVAGTALYGLRREGAMSAVDGRVRRDAPLAEDVPRPGATVPPVLTAAPVAEPPVVRVEDLPKAPALQTATSRTPAPLQAPAADRLALEVRLLDEARRAVTAGDGAAAAEALARYDQGSGQVHGGVLTPEALALHVDAARLAGDDEGAARWARELQRRYAGTPAAARISCTSGPCSRTDPR